MSEATLRDVAKLAGVSLGTASQALNNKSNVSPEKRARVLEAASTLNYQATTRTPVTSTQPISVLGMLVRQDFDAPLALNSFYSYVLAGIERECQRQNLSLMYANIQVDNMNRAVSFPPLLLNQQVDGILVVGAFLQDTIEHIREVAEKPIILVDAYTLGTPYDSVVTDNINGVYNAVSYLIEAGHRQIGLIGSSPEAYPSIRERRKGYSRALKHHDLNQTDYIEDSFLTMESGYEATMRLLKRAPQVTAIFACNDNVAFAVINAARDLGLDIPGDLSVIGFDDIDLAQEVRPALTTVHVDKVMMGVIAVRQLRDRAEDISRPTMTTALSTQLIIRESVARLVS
ncbi:MAG TPA: LacI family DNA-binding transcriptional regulator [Phototrophicaceae bacterium]|nr:LacI family DNA-binding transcriptional regulator [Phototrophicaceae bacterium]